MKTTPEILDDLRALAVCDNYRFCLDKADALSAYIPALLADLEELQAKLVKYERTDGQPSELEMHRADYQACKAAGFESPGELLDAYEKQTAKLAAAKEKVLDITANMNDEVVKYTGRLAAAEKDVERLFVVLHEDPNLFFEVNTNELVINTPACVRLELIDKSVAARKETK